MCSACGASVYLGGEEERMHDRFHTGMVPIQEALRLSNVKWCDAGDHAFKAGTPGSQSATMQEADEDGIMRSVNMDMCADHALTKRTFQALDSKAATIDHD